MVGRVTGLRQRGFREPLGGADDLTQAALSTYTTFVGKLWERYGEPTRTG